MNQVKPLAASRQLLTEKDVAAILQVAIPTLRKWRCERKGPPFVKIGAAVRYRTADLDQFIGEHRIDPYEHEVG